MKRHPPRLPHFFLCATALQVGLLGCASTTSSPGIARAGAPATTGVVEQAWSPGPGASEALGGLLDRQPFELPASELAMASGGPVPTMHAVETLLIEHHTVLTETGAAEERDRVVFRILKDEPNQTQTFTWSPWRQTKPRIRARVVTAQGSESWVQEANVVEGTVNVDGIELSDVRQLSVALPNARLGSVVELEVRKSDTRPLLEGAGAMSNWPLWSVAPLRRLRFSIEAPASVSLTVDSVGVPPAPIERRSSSQRVQLDVAQPPFSPFALTRSELAARAPRFGWSTAKSWRAVAASYRAVAQRALASEVDLSEVTALAAGATSRRDKVTVVQRWISERVRYTALHLGEGAIVPTPPGDVLTRGFGDCKDLSVLTVLALKRAGVEAQLALVRAGGEPSPEALPGLGAFNHMIVVLPASASEGRLWLDATAPEYPPGIVPLGVRNQKALIIAPETTGLTPTPTADESPFVMRQTFELVAAPFAIGRATVRVEYQGAAEGSIRSAAKVCDSGTAHRLARPWVETVLGDAPFEATLAGCTPGDGPVVVTVDMPKVDRLDTGDHHLHVTLPSRLADLALEGWLLNRADADSRTDAQKADERKRFLEQTGIPEETFLRRAASLENRALITRLYRIRLPPRFALAALPTDRTLSMGPTTWSERYRKVGESTVEVQFEFEVNKSEWSVGEVEDFRQAFWKRFDEPVPQLSASFEPLQLLDQKRPTEAVALMKRWLAERPMDGPTRARYARVLLRLGLGELAQREADRAVKDSPEDPLVLMVCADAARHNEFGVLYRPPFNRKRVLTCIRGAREVLPDHGWATVVLADTLRRNDNGEREAVWSAEVEEAAGLLRQAVERREVGADGAEMLFDIYLTTGRSAELKQLLSTESVASAIRQQNASAGTVVDMLVSGAEGLLRRLERISDAKARFQAILTGYGSLVALRRYDEAGAFLAGVRHDPALERELAAARAMHQGLARAPSTIVLSSPEAAARTLVAQLSNSSSPTDAARRLAGLAAPSARAVFDGSPRLFDFVRLPELTLPYVFDQLHSRGTCRTDSVGVVSRVQCEVVENQQMAATSFWVAEGGTHRLVSLGRPSHLAELAWRAAQQQDLKVAGAWLSWLVEELKARGAASRGSALLEQLWSDSDRQSLKAVRFATAVAVVIDPSGAENAGPEVMAELRTGRAQLSGALRRAADATLASTLEQQQKYDAAISVFAPVATSENEQWMWRYLASLESKGGGFSKAISRIETALKKNRSNPEWRELKALVELRAGRYAEALGTLEALDTEKPAGLDIRNNLLWARLMAQRLDEDAERSALRIANDDSASEASLHTAAMVLLERGRVVEAAQLAGKRQNQLRELDGAQWLLRGRLLQLLDFRDSSHAAYRRIGDDRELVDLVRRYEGR